MYKKPFPPHPGTIVSVEESTGKITMKKADEVPQRHRFVYLTKQGQETEDERQAVERIPIVEVHMLALDGNDQAVPTDKSVKMFIREYGPEQRLLRSTTMLRQ